MVTAGVFMVVRCSPIYEHAPAAAGFVTVIGAVTALFAATVGVAQNDIKRVIAYSTCSQLGYMFFAAGVGAYGAAMFHLFTHAFFKALLFLGSGAVIHALHDEQDMRQMGGLKTKLPWTWVLMIIGTLSLTGVGIPGTLVGFAGFFSKDRIIEDAFLAGQAGLAFGMFAFWIGVIAAFLTSFYSWRLILMTFHGPYAGHDPAHFDHAHEAPWVMRGPLVVLAAGAALAGVAFAPLFVGAEAQGFWREAIYHAAPAEEAHEAEAAAPAVVEEGAGEAASAEAAGEAAEEHHLPAWVLWAPFAVTAAGFLLAMWAYLWNRGVGARIAAHGGPLYKLLYNKWYFDEIYDFIFVRAARGLGDLFWKGGDQKVIDGLGPDGVAATTLAGGRRVSRIQTGYLYHYAFVILLGVAAFATWLLWRATQAGSAG
jgi:NADH-quinone oxidoreductase subunit L